MFAIALVASCLISEPGIQNADIAEKVVTLTNRERLRAGLSELTLNAKLTQSAQWLAEDMASRNYFDHLDRQGRRTGARVYDFGYRAYSTVAENLAAGQDSPEQVVSTWMSSPGHRKNILNPELRELGVGYAKSTLSAYGSYWVETFGKRPTYVSQSH